LAFASLKAPYITPDGLDVEAVFQHRKATGSILGYPGAKEFRNSGEGLEQPCDILVPAALENQITGENAGRIQAKLLPKVPTDQLARS
jgi:glutamate dehydrogenase (NAD(P)+)